MSRSFKFLTVALYLSIAVVATITLTNTMIMAQETSSSSSSNLAKGQAFLKENATKPGVHTTPSGLQYKVITEGHGKSPKATDTVLVHYRGTTIDGTEFDSSYKRNEPISFPLNGVIPGWTEGVQLMKEGGKLQLFIPSNLAYGSRGAGGVIPPDATLIFDIELLKVQ
ncbi:MAG: FKBP-type peptidyl-prolyl cis-trans isomerase [Verrucomicrobia bacterium]|nr:FKBP-type peptidyl-prolyl cis-trans isomerase [Verrucomicrobiota bacterium]